MESNMQPVTFRNYYNNQPFTPAIDTIHIDGNIDVVIFVDTTKPNAVQVQGLPKGMRYHVNDTGTLDVFKSESTVSINDNTMNFQNYNANQKVSAVGFYGNYSMHSDSEGSTISYPGLDGKPVFEFIAKEPPALVYITVNSLQKIILNNGIGRSCTINGNVTTLNVESYGTRTVILGGNVTTLNVTSGNGVWCGMTLHDNNTGVTLIGSATTLNASVYNNIFAKDLIVQQTNVNFLQMGVGRIYVNAAKVDSITGYYLQNQFINTHDAEQPKPPKPW